MHQLNALDIVQGDALPLELQLDAAAQFAGYILMPGGRGAHLEAHGGSRLIERLQAEEARPIHKRLGPRWIAAQGGSGSVEKLQQLFLGQIWRDGYVNEGLRPIAAEVGESSDFAVGKGYQGAARIANDSAAQ
jgi:hypothetical protein